MKKPSIISYYTFIACALIIIAGVLSGKLSFGHGLGDLFYLLTLIIAGIAMTVFFIILRRNSHNSGLPLFFLATIITP